LTLFVFINFFGIAQPLVEEYARPNFQQLLLAIFLRLLSPAPIYFTLAAQRVEFFFDAAAN
jgi:hypothetical protein